ncbi:type II secretion system minor pseudopilin GspK [Pelotalea chapellei]|uniref:Type II secretion system minor pseudopilin GspK n=1 Tax=Pelotalea chapellei TaxID=44671 RepID=A0ABS5U4X8_9BACT|nr:type II secretion system minor pseudopilin GspK [Pelotalea chapellei]MBT1070725.1 type II secretion system minor pseudopilin GspK [Pelotalea chapellei]
MIRHARGEKGFALVLTLVITALMVAVTSDLVYQAYVDISLSRGFRDGQQASLLAESGVIGGTKLLQLALSNQEYSSLSDAWAAPQKMDDETGTIEVSISDESGKINLNGLISPNGEFEPFTLSALKRLGARLEIPDEAWSALADWLDSNDQTRSGGAETPYYAALKIPYKARNGALVSVAELTLIKGFTPALVAKLRPFVTTHAGQPNAPFSQVNINTAPKEVIAALDERIDDRLAERIMEERRLNPFKNTGELSRVPGFDTIATGLSGRINVKGNLFRIVSLARVKESGRKVDVVVRQSGTTQDVLSWQEY